MIYHYLDLSMAHISQRDSEILSGKCQGLPDFITAAAYEEGVFVSIPAELSEDQINLPEVTNLSIAFFTVLVYARKVGCDVIRFDRDAATIDSLTVFDW